ncbi:MAG: hypothetical protein H0T76_18970 [Nannocystis sp.]|nr:hypothetical protein [Nannocystis sp.]MBA3548571.1 hypothetical protein [Nannocystis sp.]
MSDPRPRSISWKLLLLHALLPLLVIVLIGGGAAASGRVVDPNHFGQGLGRYAIFPMLTAGAASYMLQTGHRNFGRVLVILVGVMLAGLFALVVRLVLG